MAADDAHILDLEDRMDLCSRGVKSSVLSLMAASYRLYSFSIWALSTHFLISEAIRFIRQKSTVPLDRPT